MYIYTYKYVPLPPPSNVYLFQPDIAGNGGNECDRNELVCMRHGTHMNESWYTYEWAMSHMWMSHGPHLNESCHTCEWVMVMVETRVTEKRWYAWVMSRMWMNHGTHMNESWHTYEWVMSHIWMRHVTHVNESWWWWRRGWQKWGGMHESWYAYEWITVHICMSHGTHEWFMSHIWMRHVTHVNESWWWLRRGWQKWGGMQESYHTYEWVMAHIWMSHVTHMNESCHTCECVMSHIWISHVTQINGSASLCPLSLCSAMYTCQAPCIHGWMAWMTCHSSMYTWMNGVNDMSFIHVYMDEWREWHVIHPCQAPCIHVIHPYPSFIHVMDEWRICMNDMYTWGLTCPFIHDIHPCHGWMAAIPCI